MYPENFIVNADDFGIDLSISKGILKCVENNLINSFSVVPFKDEPQTKLLKTIIEQYPQIKIGCHLSLIETQPLLESTLENSADKRPPKNFKDFLMCYLTGRISTDKIKAEFMAQINWLQSLGVYIEHLDSHQHIHILPGVWRVVDELRKEFSINRVRVPFESFGASAFRSFPFGLAMQILAGLRSRPEEKFFGFLTSTKYNYETYNSKYKEILKNPQVHYELMVHPGHIPQDSEIKFSEWNANWEGEILELGKLKGFFQGFSGEKSSFQARPE